MNVSRRTLLRTFLFGRGAIGLRSLFSGLPAGLLLAADAARPDKFARAASQIAGRAPQFVLFSTSAFGDPVNCNVPGTYDDPSIAHPADPSMAPTVMTLGDVTTKAAGVWSSLPARMRARTSFFHHGTYTVVHPDITKVLNAQGTTRGGEMLPSVLSLSLAPALNTLRQQPVDFNELVHGAITCGGVLQPTLTPSSLASTLSSPRGALGQMNVVKLRDQTVDAVHAWLRRNGQPQQKALLDQYTLSRNQARSLQQNVVAQLGSITGNDAAAQIQAALLLFKMRVTPVVMMSLGFGGDNHHDPELRDEVTGHKNALANLGRLPDLIDAAGLTDQVTFCLLNVFGRTLAEPALTGRNHNDKHAVSLLYGPNVRAGVVGGVAPQGSANAYGARGIDSESGAASDGGDVAFADTLASCAKTLVAAAGVDDARADAAVSRGKIIRGALRG